MTSPLPSLPETMTFARGNSAVRNSAQRNSAQRNSARRSSVCPSSVCPSWAHVNLLALSRTDPPRCWQPQAPEDCRDQNASNNQRTGSKGSPWAQSAWKEEVIAGNPKPCRHLRRSKGKAPAVPWYTQNRIDLWKASFFLLVVRGLAFVWAAFAMPGLLLADHQQDSPPSRPKPERFAKSIAKFAQADAQQPPEHGGVLFVGSSSIRLWDLETSFPQLFTINRGFGGSHLNDSIHFAEQIIMPHRPQTVIIYAGDNDLAYGISPQQVAEDYQRLCSLIHRHLPQTRIVYIAIKPSIARFKLLEKIQAANGLIRRQTEADDRQQFVDIFTPMLDQTGRPRRELFRQDGLHLSKRGYQLWTRLVRPHTTSRQLPD